MTQKEKDDFLASIDWWSICTVPMEFISMIDAVTMGDAKFGRDEYDLYFYWTRSPLNRAYAYCWKLGRDDQQWLYPMSKRKHQSYCPVEAKTIQAFEQTA